MHDVTIIVPVYCTTEESLEWLGECLESAKKQDCYIVAVDDGSPLDASSIIRKFRGIDYYNGAHHGVAATRNQAVLRATTQLILPLDCDDRLVSGSVSKLLGRWDNSTPVYPDVRKFGEINEPHYVLLDFTCEHIYTHVGFTSVNVLHRRDQWKAIGGWNSSLEFYEDGEYNARLFSIWCAVHFPEPLVEYRIHSTQRTKTYKAQSAAYAKIVLSMIRRLDMPCTSCSKRRGNVTDLSNMDTSGNTLRVAGANTPVDVNSLPGEIDGRILSEYTGGQGRGKHYYRGVNTNFAYKVQYKDLVYADPADVKDPANTSYNDRSLLVKVIQRKIIPTPTPFPVVTTQPDIVPEVDVAPIVEKPAVVRKPKTDVKRKAKSS